MHGVKEPLVRFTVEAELNNTNVYLPTLIDCGSTASFVNPERLPEAIKNKVRDFINFGENVEGLELKRIKLTE